MKKWSVIVFMIQFFFLGRILVAVERPVILDSPKAGGDFPLVFEKSTADVCVDAADFKVVQIAAENLAGDVERVTGIKPAIKLASGSANFSKSAVLIGTLGKSVLIDGLVKAGKLNVSGIRGKWESYLIVTVQNPLPGVESGLVIAGSDRRGTAFGVFELSESIGVSPWYWWADVTPRHRDTLVIGAGTYVQGPPSVKYRGIFINDEDWSLQPWAAKTFEPETKDIGPKTYAKIFELLLRLKANYLWPAMHPCTKAFNFYPENKRVADDYGIVMGASHCEQMLRNNVGEWDIKIRGEWNYETNRDNIVKYWEERLQENGKYDNIYTIGMRGIHDGAMPGGGTLDEKTARLQRVIGDQREMISKLVNPHPEQVTQIFCPYKEVLDLYQNGLKLPEDVTLVWPDDNYGYIRQLSNPDEQRRKGGAGVYYHASYWGAPADYLWLCTTPPALIWEEMTKAYDYNARNVWVLNVGGMKKAEIAMDFFLRLAWDIHFGSPPPATKSNGQVPVAFDQSDVLEQWAARTFSSEHARETATILDEYYRLNFAAKPEHLLQTNFSFDNYNEAQERLDHFAALMKKTDALFEKIEPPLKDAFFEMVVYPVRGSALMNEKILNAVRSRELEAQGSPEAGAYTTKAQKALDQIQEETRHFNDDIAGGKWKYAVSSAPRKLAVFQKPEQAVKPLPASQASATPVVAESKKNSVTEKIPTGFKGWIESDGIVSIPTEKPSRVINRGSSAWKIIDGLGRENNAMEVLPATNPSVASGQIAAKAPALEYGFATISNSGNAQVTVHCIPSHEAAPGAGLRYAVAIDDESPRIVNIEPGKRGVDLEKNGAWKTNVLRGAVIGVSDHTIKSGGMHALHIWALDAGVAVEKIVIDLGGLKPSHLGPPETLAKDGK
jgi:hypothetical protein